MQLHSQKNQEVNGLESVKLAEALTPVLAKAAADVEENVVEVFSAVLAEELPEEAFGN